MAKTAVATGNALTRKHWEEKLHRDTLKESYWSKFMSNDGKSLVHVKTDLEKEKGDKITFGIRMRLAGDGVTSGTALEGNEEALVTYDSSVSLEEYAHAVRDKGPLDRTRPVYDMDTESKNALMDWGTEKIDALCFTAIALSPTKFLYRDQAAGAFTGGTVAATVATAMSATNSLITLNFISAVKTWAKTGGNRSYTPLRPVKVDGKMYYVMLVHPDVLYDLKTNADFQTARREAELRGKDNPLFEGSVAVWDGVIIHEHENVTVATNGGGGSVRYAKCSFLGAQSLCWAWGARGKIVAEEFDYEREHGYAWSMMSGVAKPVFNSKDYGSIGLYIACSNISAQ